MSSWDAALFRCQICFVPYAGAVGCDTTPVVVCENLHKMCTHCIKKLQTKTEPVCPQCRGVLWHDPIPSRDLIEIISQCKLACGLCADTTLMSWQGAQIHSARCPESIVSCPMLKPGTNYAQDHDQACGESMSLSKLWDHFLSHHMSRDPITFQETDGTGGAHGVHNTYVTIKDIQIKSQIFFASMQNASGTHNIAIHTELCRQQKALAIYLRRGYSSECITIEKTIFAISVDTCAGLFYNMCDSTGGDNTVQCSEKVDAEYIVSNKNNNILLVPYQLLHAKNSDIVHAHTPPSITLTIQLFLKDKST